METTDAYDEEAAVLRRFLDGGVDDGAIARYHDALAARRPGWSLSGRPCRADRSAVWIELVLAAPDARARRYLVYRAVLRPGDGGLWHVVISGSGFDMPALLADLGLPSSQSDASEQGGGRFDEVVARIGRHGQLHLDGSTLPAGPDTSPFAYIYATHLPSGAALTLCLDVHPDGTCRLRSSGVGEPYRLVTPS